MSPPRPLLQINTERVKKEQRCQGFFRSFFRFFFQKKRFTRIMREHTPYMRADLTAASRSCIAHVERQINHGKALATADRMDPLSPAELGRQYSRDFSFRKFINREALNLVD
jgi:hypothetical protein